MKEGTNGDNVVQVGIWWYKKGFHDTVRDKVVEGFHGTNEDNLAKRW